MLALTLPSPEPRAFDTIESTLILTANFDETKPAQHLADRFLRTAKSVKDTARYPQIIAYSLIFQFNSINIAYPRLGDRTGCGLFFVWNS